MTAIDEFLPFLTLSTRSDLKRAALQTLLGVTVDSDGCQLLASNLSLLQSLAVLLKDKTSSTVEDSYSALINLSSEECVAEILTDMVDPPLTRLALSHIVEEDGAHIDAACKLLCNLTRSEVCGKRVLEVLDWSFGGVEKLVEVFCTEEARLHKKPYHLAGVFANLTQLPEVRKCLVTDGHILRLLPFTTYMQSNILRKGVVGTVRNCCFDVDHHELLLSEEVDITPFLLLPLAGPEEFDDEDNAQLPVDLQYLGEDKERDPNPDNRKLLLEAILQLCATKTGRQILREKQAYLILRELHKWEKVASVRIVCENAVQMLIREEPEIGVDNLKEVDVPDDMIEKLQKMNEDELKLEEEELIGTT